jgi:hypothetical protein
VTALGPGGGWCSCRARPSHCELTGQGRWSRLCDTAELSWALRWSACRANGCSIVGVHVCVCACVYLWVRGAELSGAY